jgi:hypothetical protein
MFLLHQQFKIVRAKRTHFHWKLSFWSPFCHPFDSAVRDGRTTRNPPPINTCGVFDWITCVALSTSRRPLRTSVVDKWSTVWKVDTLRHLTVFRKLNVGGEGIHCITFPVLFLIRNRTMGSLCTNFVSLCIHAYVHVCVCVSEFNPKKKPTQTISILYVWRAPWSPSPPRGMRGSCLLDCPSPTNLHRNRVSFWKWNAPSLQAFRVGKPCSMAQDFRLVCTNMYSNPKWTPIIQQL